MKLITLDSQPVWRQGAVTETTIAFNIHIAHTVHTVSVWRHFKYGKETALLLLWITFSYLFYYLYLSFLFLIFMKNIQHVHAPLLQWPDTTDTVSDQFAQIFDSVFSLTTMDLIKICADLKSSTKQNSCDINMFLLLPTAQSWSLPWLPGASPSAGQPPPWWPTEQTKNMRWINWRMKWKHAVVYILKAFQA